MNRTHSQANGLLAAKKRRSQRAKTAASPTRAATPGSDYYGTPLTDPIFLACRRGAVKETPFAAVQQFNPNSHQQLQECSPCLPMCIAVSPGGADEYGSPYSQTEEGGEEVRAGEAATVLLHDRCSSGSTDSHHTAAQFAIILHPLGADRLFPSSCRICATFSSTMRRTGSPSLSQSSTPPSSTNSSATAESWTTA